MNTQTQNTILALFAAALLLAPLAGFAQGRGGGAEAGQHQAPAQVDRGQRDYDRDMARSKSRVDEPAYDRDRVQDQTHAPDFAKLDDRDIYGSGLMSESERNAYRQSLQAAGSAEERANIEARHKKTIEARAEKQGVDVAPPGQEIYGGAMMTIEERNVYREELRVVGNDPEKQAQFMADHKEKMQARAKAQGAILDNETEEAE